LSKPRPRRRTAGSSPWHGSWEGAGMRALGEDALSRERSLPRRTSLPQEEIASRSCTVRTRCGVRRLPRFTARPATCAPRNFSSASHVRNDVMLWPPRRESRAPWASGMILLPIFVRDWPSIYSEQTRSSDVFMYQSDVGPPHALERHHTAPTSTGHWTASATNSTTYNCVTAHEPGDQPVRDDSPGLN
jgi:hypothetical protein